MSDNYSSLIAIRFFNSLSLAEESFLTNGKISSYIIEDIIGSKAPTIPISINIVKVLESFKKRKQYFILYKNIKLKLLNYAKKSGS